MKTALLNPILPVVQAELESSRGKVILHDTAADKADKKVLQPNGRHDFIIRHDVKEVGQHTLTCSASYLMPDGERRTLPQSFKFTSTNPLSVRTKVAQGIGLQWKHVFRNQHPSRKFWIHIQPLQMHFSLSRPKLVTLLACKRKPRT